MCIYTFILQNTLFCRINWEGLEEGFEYDQNALQEIAEKLKTWGNIGNSTRLKRCLYSSSCPRICKLYIETGTNCSLNQVCSCVSSEFMDGSLTVGCLHWNRGGRHSAFPVKCMDPRTQSQSVLMPTLFQPRHPGSCPYGDSLLNHDEQRLRKAHGHATILPVGSEHSKKQNKTKQNKKQWRARSSSNPRSIILKVCQHH